MAPEFLERTLALLRPSRLQQAMPFHLQRLYFVHTLHSRNSSRAYSLPYFRNIALCTQHGISAFQSLPSSTPSSIQGLYYFILQGLHSIQGLVYAKPSFLSFSAYQPFNAYTVARCTDFHAFRPVPRHFKAFIILSSQYCTFNTFPLFFPAPCLFVSIFADQGHHRT